jgi:hypothetical protein
MGSARFCSSVVVVEAAVDAVENAALDAVVRKAADLAAPRTKTSGKIKSARNNDRFQLRESF